MPLDLVKFKKYQQQYHILNRERRIEIARKNHLRRKFGITEEEYDKLLKLQNNCCAICGSDKPGDKRAKYFSVDHDHDTKKVRGLLCAGCNRGIGYLKDSIEILYNAFTYLTNKKGK